MIICAIDFESTGVDTKNDRITEIGAVIFTDATNEGLLELDRYSALVFTPGVTLSDEVVEVTGITDLMLEAEGMPLENAFHGLITMLSKQGWPSAFIAHNKAFDQALFMAEMLRLLNDNKIPREIADHVMAIPWLCSIADMTHPEKFRSKKLSHLALDYGVAVDPSKLHRATDDCELLVNMLDKANVDFSALMLRAKTPDVIIRAVVPSPFGAGNDGGKGKDKAKSLGFGWQRAPGTDGPEYKNCWVKKVKENEVPQIKKELGYEVTIVG